MIRFIIALFLALPCAAQPPTRYLPEPFWRWESSPCHSHYTAENTPDGPRFCFTIDVRGPTWLVVDVIPCPQGVTVEARQTCTGYIAETSYLSWDDMLASRDEAAIWLRACLMRADIGYE